MTGCLSIIVQQSISIGLILVFPRVFTGYGDVVHGAEGVDVAGVSNGRLVVQRHRVQDVGASLVLDAAVAVLTTYADAYTRKKLS